MKGACGEVRGLSYTFLGINSKLAWPPLSQLLVKTEVPCIILNEKPSLLLLD